MRSLLILLFVVILPLPGLAQTNDAQPVYLVKTGSVQQATSSINGWTYSNPSGAALANYADPNIQVLSYDNEGRITSYILNGQQHYIVYFDDSSSQTVKTAAVIAVEHAVNSQNLLASQRAIDRSIFDRLFTTLITNRLGGRGLGAGDGPGASLAAWVDGSYTLQGSSQPGSQHASNQFLVLTGVDYAPTERVTLGISAGFNQNYTEYHVDKGGNQRDDYFVFNPYAGVNLFDNAFLGLQAGIKYGSTTLKGKTNSDYQSLTTSAGAFATYAFLWDRFMFNPMVGYTYTYRNPYADSVTSNALGMFKAGGRFTWQAEKFVPYLDLTYNYDTIGQTNAQRSDMLGTLGFDFIPNAKWRVSLFVSNTFFRDKEYSTTFDLNLRYCF